MDMKELEFKVQNITTCYAIDNQLLLDANRIKLEIVNEGIRSMLKATIDILTKEELLVKYPADWWQAFKERWFPKWLKRKHPVKYTECFAQHLFPEQSFPNFGREVIKLKMVSPDYIDSLVKDPKYEQYPSP